MRRRQRLVGRVCSPVIDLEGFGVVVHGAPVNRRKVVEYLANGAERDMTMILRAETV